MIDKADKLIKRAHAELSEKNYYEAHQIVRTVYYRLLDSQQYDKLLDFLHTTCLLFIQAKEYNISLDLAELYVDTLLKSRVPIHEKELNRFAQMFSLLPPKFATDDNGATAVVVTDRRNNLLNKAVKWSIEVADTPTAKLRGHSALHLKLARIFRAEANYEAALMHYPVANFPEEFAEFLIDYQQRMSVEIDTLIVQSVFQILCYKKLKSAIIVFKKYTNGHPDIGPKTPYDFELINFTWLMLRSVAQRNLPYFTELVETYQQVLARDSNYFLYLDKIGQLYLNLPPANNCQTRTQGGFLGSLLKEFIGQKSNEPEIVEEPEEFDEALATDPFVVGPLPPGVLSEQDVSMGASTSGTPSPSKSTQLSERHEAEMDLD